mgnify:CR=1 FL=1
MNLCSSLEYLKLNIMYSSPYTGLFIFMWKFNSPLLLNWLRLSKKKLPFYISFADNTGASDNEGHEQMETHSNASGNIPLSQSI